MTNEASPFFILRCTDKVTKKINGYRKNDIESNNPFLDWNVHLFRANRAQYLIYTNTASLLSFVTPGNGITNDIALIKNATSTIRDGLISAGFPFFYEKYVAASTGKVIFTKTNNRHVLGSMNDLIKSAKWLMEYEGFSPFSVSKELNEMPMKIIKYDSPVEVVGKMGIDRPSEK